MSCWRRRGAGERPRTTCCSTALPAWARRPWPRSSPREMGVERAQHVGAGHGAAGDWWGSSRRSIELARCCSSTGFTGSVAAVEEILYPAMEDFAVDMLIGKGPARGGLRLTCKPFTVIGATTRGRGCSGPLRDRFGATYRLDFYSDDDLTAIVAGDRRASSTSTSSPRRPARSRGVVLPTWCPTSRGASMTCAKSSRGWSTAASCSSSGPRWARNLVVGFARLRRLADRRHRQPAAPPGRLSRCGGERKGRLVREHVRPLRAATRGARPTRRGSCRVATQEHAGVIRHGASLLRAFATATVPRVTVTLRQAFGGAHIVMNSRDLGATLTLAWPSARIGVMGAKQAVQLVRAARDRRRR